MDKEDIKKWFEDKWCCIVRFFKHKWQEYDRGFSDKVTWDLYTEIAKFIHPRLVLFKNLNNGYPVDLTEKKWNIIINKMILSFELILDSKLEESWYLNNKFNKKKMTSDNKKIQDGLDLFSKYYRNLWW